jgi:hypothetical protein
MNVISRLYDEKKHYFRPALSYNYSYNRLPCDIYELIARSFIGAVYLLLDGDVPEISSPYCESIRKGTNPESSYYWGKLNEQRIVENASLTIGLLLHRKIFWENFTRKEKQNIISYIKQTAKHETYFNNWMWFRLFHYFFLEQFEGTDHRVNICRLYHKISTLYRGDGWYNDRGSSDNNAFDEYNGCTYHYYGPLFCLLADDRYNDIKETVKSHLGIFCENFLNFFRKNSLPLFWGRSMAHRFANMASLCLGIKLGVIGREKYPCVNAKLSGTINLFLRRGSLDYRGLLSPSYLQPIRGALEGYCGIGSSYWALKAFSVLLLEDSHPFWQKKDSGKDCEHSKKIVLKSIPICIESNGSDEIFMLNGTIFTTKWDKRKYNAFAYSNTFPIVLDSTYVSNALILLHKCRKKIRDRIIHWAVIDDVFQIEWGVSSINGLKAYTTMVPFDQGYCLIHKIESPVRMNFVYSGFALPEEKLVRRVQQDESMEIHTPGYISRLTVISGTKATYGCKKLSAKKCVINKETIIPWCRSHFVKGMNTVVTYAQATNKDSFKLVRVIRNNCYIEIRKPDGRVYQMVEDTDSRFYHISDILKT